jgi:phage-related protein
VQSFLSAGQKLMDNIKQGINNMLSAVVGAAKAVISAAIDGIKSFFESIKQVGGNLMTKLKDGISGMLSSVVDTAKSIGKNIVDGIWNGISAGWDWLKEKVGGLAKSLFDSAKSALGISSPSKKFRYLGEMCVAGFDEGAEELMDGSAFGAAVNNSFATVAANTGSLNGGISRGQTFNFYDTQTSPDAIRRKVQNTMTFGLAGGI